MSSAAENLPPFYYTNTDPNPPSGVPGYPMVPGNLSPALLVWLFLTTNPAWIPIIAGGGIDPAMGNLDGIAGSVGLTSGTVQWIFDLAKTPVDPTVTPVTIVADAMQIVGAAFQEIKGAYSGPGSYVPPYCPRDGSQVLQLAKSLQVQNPPNAVPEELAARISRIAERVKNHPREPQ